MTPFLVCVAKPMITPIRAIYRYGKLPKSYPSHRMAEGPRGLLSEHHQLFIEHLHGIFLVCVAKPMITPIMAIYRYGKLRKSYPSHRMAEGPRGLLAEHNQLFIEHLHGIFISRRHYQALQLLRKNAIL